MSALLELADDEFQRIRNESYEELKDQTINNSTIQLYIRSSKILRNIFKDIQNKGISKMTLIEDKRYLSELVEYYQNNNIQIINQIENEILVSDKISVFLSLIENSDYELRLGPISILLLISYESDESITREYLESKGWVDPYLSLLVSESKT